MSFILTVVLGDGDSDASEAGGRAPEGPDQDQEMHTASSGKRILYACFIFSVGLNIKAINILYIIRRSRLYFLLL